MPVNLQSLNSDPNFLSLPKSRRDEIIAGLTSSGGALPTPIGGLKTPAPTPMPTPSTPVPPGSVLSTEKVEDVMEGVSQKETQLLQPYLGSAAKYVPHPPASVPEAIGFGTMLATGGASLPYRLLAPPIAAGLSSYLAGSRVSPETAMMSTGAATLGGEVLGGVQGLHSGGVASKFLERQRGKDLAEVGDELSTNMPEVTAGRPLTKVSEYLEYFGRKPEDIIDPKTGLDWGYFKRMGKFVEQRAEGSDARVKATEGVLKSAQKRLEELVKNPKPISESVRTGADYLKEETERKWALGSAQRQVAAAERQLDFYTKEAEQFRSQSRVLTNEWEKRQKPFEALQDLFGERGKFEASPSKRLTFDTNALAEKLSDAKQVAKLREAGVPDEVINNLRRIAYGQPRSTMPSKIMTERDVAGTQFHGGGRLHEYHGPPTLGAHVNIPEPAQLAGSRQRAIDYNKALNRVARYLGQQFGYSVDEPDYGEIHPSPAAVPEAKPTPGRR